ncbi:hypothetical protein B0H19DRAFT_1262492 [Mycena capillaripes]|nr:hypothetical protein B0H19DRAFT_1262492 [Mycena capillaripes]
MSDIYAFPRIIMDEEANTIVPGDFTNFKRTFAELAKNKVNVRNTFFQAASYWCAADFLLHGN